MLGLALQSLQLIGRVSWVGRVGRIAQVDGIIPARTRIPIIPARPHGHGVVVEGVVAVAPVLLPVEYTVTIVTIVTIVGVGL